MTFRVSLLATVGRNMELNLELIVTRFSGICKQRWGMRSLQKGLRISRHIKTSSDDLLLQCGSKLLAKTYRPFNSKVDRKGN